ncbi:MAG TPA: GNAT family N-acetyltransferase [Anaerolineales bacterium]|nr:GNAT family N-acetyltransferase [Anaerolineales bacterium]
MNPPLIRKANLQDSAALAGLCTQLGYPSTGADLLQRLPGVLDRPDHTVIVAEVEGRLAGWIHVHVSPSLETDRMAELGGLVVDENQRGAGIGKALLDEAEDWARQKGCGELWLRSNILRKAAHGFYAARGYTNLKTSYTFRKQL